MAKGGRIKSGNRHASNQRRHKRKYGGWRVKRRGNCGSSFCSRATGCEPSAGVA